MASVCQLQYPERFHAAAMFMDHLSNGEMASTTDETKLLLYALRQQASKGPCQEPRPSRWNFVESAKWESWHHLAKMSTFEAMHLYVRTLEQTFPAWWDKIADKYTSDTEQSEDLLNAAVTTEQSAGVLRHNSDPMPLIAANGVPPVASCPTPSTPPAKPQPIPDQALTVNTWVQLELASTPHLPTKRYEHASFLLNSSLYILAGTGPGSRHFNDLWLLDLSTLTWSNPSAHPDTPAGPAPATEPATPNAAPRLPPCSSLTAIPHGSSILLIGGRLHRKHTTPTLQLLSLDPTTLSFSALPTSGPIPEARGGHTATRLGDRVYIFGGEDLSRRALSDLQILDLPTMTWLEPPGFTEAKPAPRSAHCATAYLDRYVLIFGGGAGSLCHNDLWALDTVMLTWQQLVVTGSNLGPRAGHAGVLVGHTWYLVGGGNNMRGCTDMLALNLGELRVVDSEEGVDNGVADGGEGKGPGGLTGLASCRVVCTLPQGSPLVSEGLSLEVIWRGGMHYLVAFGGYNGECNNKVSVMRLEIGSEAVQLAAAKKEVEAAQKETEAARREAASAKQEAAAAKDVGTLLQRQIVSLKQELQEAEEKLASSQQLLAASQQRCTELEGAAVALQRQVEGLERAVAQKALDVEGAAEPSANGDADASAKEHGSGGESQPKAPAGGFWSMFG